MNGDHHETRRLQCNSRPGFVAIALDYLTADKALVINVPYALRERLTVAVLSMSL
ncbi:MAG: hypothetical protein ACI9UN_002178 [Granulosicoccus sp.]|jgi:hypothetical protein